MTDAATTERQLLIDRIEGLEAEYDALFRAKREQLDAKRAELRAQCGALGHLYSKSKGYLAYRLVRGCLYCGAEEA